MPARLGNNVITFTPVDEDGAPILESTVATLEMQGPIRFSVGLKPNVWTAIMPPDEFEKIKDYTANHGFLSLWYESDPREEFDEGGEADVVIHDVSIVDVEASAFGQRVKRFNEDEWGVTEYRVTFSDYRQKFVEPRGGRLRVGLVNPTPDPVNDVEPPPAVTMTVLIVSCLIAMGESVYSVPADVDDVSVPFDLKWYGNHAPTELQKLLDACHCVYVPGLDGTGTIQEIGEGEATSFPGGERLPESKAPSVDRRGKSVIFSTFPNRVCKTRVLSGPSDDTWQFVMQDSHGKWVNQTDADILSPYSFSPESAMKDDCKNVSAKYRDRAKSQMYRFLRLNEDDDAYPDVVLTHAMDSDGGQTPLEVLAKIAVYKDSIWTNSSDPVSVPATFVKGRIIEIAFPLGKVSPNNTIHWPADFAALGDNDLTVRVTMEQSEQGDDGKRRPQYFHAGWTKTGEDEDALERMSDDDVENALDGKTPDAFVIIRDDLRKIIDEDGDNEDDLVASLEPLAEQYLANSTAETIITQARGFQEAQLSGKVNEIEWDQAKLLTTARIGNWFAPSAAITDTSLLRVGEAAKDEEYPGQKKTESDDQALGAASMTKAFRPVVPLTHDRPPPPPTDFVARVGSPSPVGLGKQWEYDFTEMEKSGSGYGHWSTKSGGRTGTLFNLIEDQNGATGLWGNGVNSAHLSGTFDIKPIPSGTRVRVFEVTRTDTSAREFWTQYENGVDGQCEDA